MIEATENLPFGKLLLQRFPLKIPKYQRSYAWDEEEIDEFIRDIKELYNIRLTDLSKPMSHFFGGIVSVKRTVAGTRSGDEYDVVDGQQRLTTMTLAINTILKGLDEIALQAIQSGDVSGRKMAISHLDVINDTHLMYPEVDGINVKKYHRLNLSKADDDFFKKLLENAGNVRKQTVYQRDSHRRLQVAWTNIYKQLVQEPIVDNVNIDITEKIRRLLLTHSCLTVDSYIIHIISDNSQEAYRLFSILNDRGKNLSDGDLLRSYTLEMLESHVNQQIMVEKSWDKILGYKDLEIDYFLKAYYPSYQGKRAPQRDLANEYRSAFFPFSIPLSDKDASEVCNRVIDMDDESRSFIEISEGIWPYQSSSLPIWDRDRLNRLIKTLKHTICLPLLLSARHCLKEVDFADLVHLLERFSFRYITIVGAHASRLGNVYNNHAKMIRQNPSNYQLSDLRKDLQKLQDEHAKDRTFENGILDQLNYGIPSMRIIIRYFLATVEDYYVSYKKGSNGKMVPDKTRLLDVNNITIEHIYPQNPKVSDPLLDVKVNSIGNLSFWCAQDNVVASNKVFPLKMPSYSQSSIAINRELAKLSDWTVKEYSDRQKELIYLAMKIFSAY